MGVIYRDGLEDIESLLVAAVSELYGNGDVYELHGASVYCQCNDLALSHTWEALTKIRRILGARRLRQADQLAQGQVIAFC